jgi:hypothetical protein
MHNAAFMALSQAERLVIAKFAQAKQPIRRNRAGRLVVIALSINPITHVSQPAAEVNQSSIASGP